MPLQPLRPTEPLVARPRLRDLGIRLGAYLPGPLNAITDVAGVQIGHVTLLEDLDTQPIRTGVTAILPHTGSIYEQRLIAAIHVINGYGKATGLAQVAELGQLETPILLTNTLGVPAAAQGLIRWCLSRSPEAVSINTVVAECNDSRLNDITGLHVSEEHARQALDDARGGPVAEGAVGAGTGMVGYGFKGGIGTASRVLPAEYPGYTVGALVLLNCGRREDLVIDGVPVGRLLGKSPSPPAARPSEGSIIIVLATDAPLSARQLGRVAGRAVVGLARTGSHIDNGSGDFVIAFSTAQRVPRDDPRLTFPMEAINETRLANPLFRAAAESTEEAILNALFTAQTAPGLHGDRYLALPVEEMLALLQRRWDPTLATTAAR